jgi:hypothetical protein
VEEMNLLLEGEKLHGPPAARVDARWSSVVSTPSTSMSTLNDGDSFEKADTPDQKFEVLKRIVPMPRPPPPSLYGSRDGRVYCTDQKSS